MKYGYKEIRRISSGDLRALCIKEDWYTGGTNEEYSNLMNMTKKENITTDDIVEIAIDIIEHSDVALGNFMDRSGLEINEFYTHVMFLIAESCHTFFEEC